MRECSGANYPHVIITHLQVRVIYYHPAGFWCNIFKNEHFSAEHSPARSPCPDFPGSAHPTGVGHQSFLYSGSEMSVFSPGISYSSLRTVYRSQHPKWRPWVLHSHRTMLQDKGLGPKCHSQTIWQNTSVSESLSIFFFFFKEERELNFSSFFPHDDCSCL